MLRRFMSNSAFILEFAEMLGSHCTAISLGTVLSWLHQWAST